MQTNAATRTNLSTKKKRIQARHVPANSRAVPYDDIEAIVYIYAGSDGRPVALAYRGTARKPVFHLRFGTESALLEYVDRWVKGRQARDSAMRAEREARRAEGHGFAVGDVVVSSWGYEQTNIDFYEVVRVLSPKTVAVRQIAATLDPDSTPGGAMSGFKRPTRGAFLDDASELVCRARGDRVHGVRRGGHTASRWDGKPQRCSWYA